MSPDVLVTSLEERLFFYSIVSFLFQGHRSHPDPDQMVTAATRIQSVSRSDDGSACRDDLYSPEHQWRPGQLDEPQRRIPSEEPVS